MYDCSQTLMQNSAEMRRLEHVSKRGRKAGRDYSRLVRVQRPVLRGGTTYLTHLWVAPSEVRKGDIVLQNQQAYREWERQNGERTDERHDDGRHEDISRNGKIGSARRIYDTHRIYTEHSPGCQTEWNIRSELILRQKQLPMRVMIRKLEELSQQITDEYGFPPEYGDRVHAFFARLPVCVKRIRGPHTWEDDLKAVNPDYPGPDVQTQHPHNTNCQYSVCAYELRRRGYDAVSRGVIIGKETGDLCAELSDVFDDGKRLRVRGEYPQMQMHHIRYLMARFGADSRAVLSFKWRSTGFGHAIIVKYWNRETRLIDPQTGREFEPRKITKMDLQSLRLMRIDDLPMNGNVNLMLSEECYSDYAQRSVHDLL